MTGEDRTNDYNGSIENVVDEYKNRPRVYLDNAAAPLIMTSIPYKAAELLTSTLLVNPHSKGRLGNATQSLIEETRNEVLKLFNADLSEYELVFCANATAGIKIVGECLEKSHLLYNVDSHTSIVGLRELSNNFETFTDEMSLKNRNIGSNSVVAWPLQSNFDGRRYPGEPWISYVHEKGGLVLLDVASYVATDVLNLKAVKPDFAAVSFYKIFGYPDLGGLLVRKTSATRDFISRKRYFGGGTVESLAPVKAWNARPIASFTQLLEDGTLPIHNILALKAAIIEFKRVFGMNFSYKIAQHTKAVAARLRRNLSALSHCVVFNVSADANSSIVTFQPTTIGHNEFAEAAAQADIHVRSGTLCNIGAFTLSSSLTDNDIVQNYKQMGKKCNDGISYVKDRPTGVIRASIGPYTSYQETDALVELVRQFEYVESQMNPGLGSPVEEIDRIVVDQLWAYPIKSCSGFRMRESLLTLSGLEYDRAFCIVNLATKNILTLKKYRVMALLKPEVKHGYLHVYYEPQAQASALLNISLDANRWEQTENHENLFLNLETEVVDFFSNIIGVPCTIAKNLEEKSHFASRDVAGLINRQSSTFANSSALLVVNTASGEALDIDDILVFRPNIVLKTSCPWIEDEWGALQLPGHNKPAEIEMIERCRRCNMVCVTRDGTTNNAPYMQLCKQRNISGRIYFGQHASLSQASSAQIISEGDELLVTKMC